MKHKTINIVHNIHLSKSQRYQIYQGEIVSVVGVSYIDVEFSKEVFCVYEILFTGFNRSIENTQNGYKIHLPFKEGDKINISNEEWFKMSIKKRNNFYNKIKPQINSKCLLDFKDGGSKQISYREHSQIKTQSEIINLNHFVKINDIEELTKSIVMLGNLVAP